MRVPRYRALGALLVVVLLPALPTRGDEAPPASVAIEPGGATLVGRRAVRQLIATATDPDGSVRDATRSVLWSSDNPDVATVSPTGRVFPKADGMATIVADADSASAQTTVAVSGQGRPTPVSFRLDVIPALSQANCNMGACHGTPTGKGGLRLSLRGYLPDQDFATLTREAGGRRINAVDADAGMILTKPLGLVPHEGGIRLTRGSKSFEAIHDWMAEGASDDPNAPPANRLVMLPGARVLNDAAKTQQVAVVAHHADGSSRDITTLCYYNSSNTDIADVDADGHVTFKRPGEAAIIAHYLDLVAIVRLTYLVQVPGFRLAEVPEDNPIDQAVFSKLNRMRISPSEASTDAEFIRRASLDAIGVLPSPDSVRAFLADPSPDRRVRLVDSLLARPEFVDFWTLKFADILRANGRLIATKGTYALNRWLRANLERNAPLDQMVRDLLTADGSTLRNPAANYYRISRDPESSVESTAQLFLGVRIQCAKCHNHPFERWTQDDYYGLAAFFSRVKRKPGGLPEDEVIFAVADGEVKQPRTGKVMKPKALGGPVFDDASASPDMGDRRDRLAAWLTSEGNPFFSKSLANRVWFHLMGRGVVEPVDDFRDSNPSSNDELLASLADGFAASGYDLRALVRSIMTSRTYQLASKTNELNGDDVAYFSHAYTKLLPAEVLLDAISTVTGTTTPFDGLPRGARAVQIPDGKLENAFLKTFGRPARELACECERESDANLSQALQLIGGATVNGKLRDDSGRMAQLAKSDLTPDQIARDLYFVALARDPDASETAAAVKHITAGPDRRQAVEDLGWALINSKEFLFRH